MPVLSSVVTILESIPRRQPVGESLLRLATLKPPHEFLHFPIALLLRDRGYLAQVLARKLSYWRADIVPSASSSQHALDPVLRDSSSRTRSSSAQIRPRNIAMSSWAAACVVGSARAWSTSIRNGLCHTIRSAMFKFLGALRRVISSWEVTLIGQCWPEKP